MKYLLYAHSGSCNHGCEAIVRTFLISCKNPDIPVRLLSYNPEQDVTYGVDKIVEEFSGYYIYSKSSPWRFYTNLMVKILHKRDERFRVFLKNVRAELKPGDIAFSIGGDNYCYTSFPETLASYNRIFHKMGLKTVLFGCSIEPELLKDQNIVTDLERYNLITARETITYNAIKGAGLNNVELCPDTAFILSKKDMQFDFETSKDGVVGINLSPRVGLSGPNHGRVFEAYKGLIRYILDSTQMDIALIPHVVSENSDDRTVLSLLADCFPGEKRIHMIPDGTCEEIKGYISKCRFMVAARTHASIAAYSTFVPTLVLGYSVKSKGIAEDLFGTYEGYVLPNDQVQNYQDLVKAFVWLQNNEEQIRNHLSAFIPEYIKPIAELPNILKELQN